MILARCRRAPPLHRLSQHGRNAHRRTITTAGRDLDRAVQSYVSTSDDPYLNLSIEHHLLQKCHPSSSVLLLYINRPCVVIGRNQNPWTEVNLSMLRAGLPQERHSAGGNPYGSASNGSSGARTAIDLVRRRSGGGTVFHDAGNVNWTVISAAAGFTRDKHAGMVVRALRRLGVAGARVNARHDIVLDVGAPPSSSPSPTSHAGQGRTADHNDTEQDVHRTPWTPNDDGADQDPASRSKKVGGSAYKLTRGRALHHGTALLNSANLALLGPLLRAPGKACFDSKGVESVSSPVANVGVGTDDFVSAVRHEFGRMYPGGGPVDVVGEEWLEVPEVKTGYDELKSRGWTFLQTPRFTLSNVGLAGSGAGLTLHVRGGIIEKVETATPAMDELVKNMQGQAVYDVRDWADLLERSSLAPDQVSELMEWLSTTLPPCPQ